ncbi:MAG: ABC transporter permease subunit [Proteobacteria bacterium]|nr:ABC transporter permease subunit [Pseudomonadota bacterium]
MARALSGTWLALVFGFMIAPLVVVAGASFGRGGRTAMIDFPPHELTWQWYLAIPGDQVQALALSISLALACALAAALLGVPAALGIVRGDLPGRRAIAALFRLPLQIPAVVVGVSFLQLYYIVGDVIELPLVGSFWGLALAHLFIALPYVVGSVVAILNRFNMRLEEAALVLGAGRWSTFRRVTLPVIMPGVFAGAVYAFMVSFSDLPVALFLAGQGFVTFPVAIFQSLDYDFSPSMLALSTLIIVFSFVVMVVVQRSIGLTNLLHTGGAG